MKLAIIYNPNDRKLLPDSYSLTYRDQFLAIIDRFEKVYHVTKSCSALDIDADVIIFYDIHSTHDIKIDGIEKHRAKKYEYFNDPHQKDHDFKTVHKLGSQERSKRAAERGVKYIICPSKNGFDKYIRPNGDFELVWFPVAPKQRVQGIPLSQRKLSVLANGSVWEGEDGFRPYEFRRWAYEQTYIDCPKKVEAGENYQKWLTAYAGALALCDTYVCPKYLEIPLSGCVTFCQWHNEYGEMGFIDGHSCIIVNEKCLEKRVNHFLTNPEKYQEIADNGRKAAEKYTSDKFADFIYDHAS